MEKQSFNWKQITAVVGATLLITKSAELVIPSLVSYISSKLGSRDEHDEEMERDLELIKKSKKSKTYDEDLFREQLARNYAFLGEEGMQKIKNTSVIVCGVGGVGSSVVTYLIRSGIHKLKIIDFDQVSLSSLNRHSCATLKDVGKPKVQVLKDHMLEIAPWCEIELANELWTLPNADRLLTFENGDKADWVVDCIDNIDTKVDLLEYLYKNGIKMISSMGAATKSDPTRINIGDISNTEEDGLARACRRKLKKRGVLENIPVVFSAEKPDPNKAQLMPLSEEEFAKGNVDQLSALQNFRVRILPVLGTMPSVFGLTITTWMLCTIAGYPVEPIVGKNRMKIYDSLLQPLASQNLKLGGESERIPISKSDIAYIVEEVFRGKSVVSGESTRLQLSRWDINKPLSLQNTVLMTKNEVKVHEDKHLKGGEKLEDIYNKDVLDLVAKRFKEENWYSNFR
ncbi:tRNA threonylcarbamoyladenosine dehydratase [Hanseniaspora guilliermondii]